MVAVPLAVTWPIGATTVRSCICIEANGAIISVQICSAVVRVVVFAVIFSSASSSASSSQVVSFLVA